MSNDTPIIVTGAAGNVGSVGRRGDKIMVLMTLTLWHFLRKYLVYFANVP
jgi:hypothetical protein